MGNISKKQRNARNNDTGKLIVGQFFDKKTLNILFHALKEQLLRFPDVLISIILEFCRKVIYDIETNSHMNKIVLLGTSGSGKSTLFKQMDILFIWRLPEETRKQYIDTIYTNVMCSIKTLCVNSDILSRESEEFRVHNVLTRIKNEILNDHTEEAQITEELAQKILDLWTDPGIQKTYNNRSLFHLTESTSYFFNRLPEIAKLPYVPTKQDVLRSRIPTTGIVECTFQIDGDNFRMFDVGGTRSERKKWIHCFENVTAVICVVALSAYNQVLYEDENKNRMEEDLALFEEISNMEWFDSSAILLFLNKSDVFREKIERVPFDQYFTDYVYTGNDTQYTETLDYVVNMFEDKCESVVYTHVTNATDSDNILHVFSAVKDIVIKKGLERAGLT